MKLIFLGPPGAGKGTHAKMICEKYNLVHLATGDCLRRNIKEGTELGRKAKDIIASGALVSDDLVNKLMADEIQQAMARAEGFILDGYPRTIGQAEALDQFCAEQNMKLDAALNFATSEAVIIERLGGRQICPKCAAGYHRKNIPPKVDNICDVCGTELVQRKDDNPETIKNRLAVYQKETAPLIEFYAKKGLLRELDGSKDLESLRTELTTLFENLQNVK